MFDDLRAELRKYRAQKGLHQVHIAQVLDVDQSTISAFETGAKSLGPEKIEKLMEILGLHLITNDDHISGTTLELLRERGASYEPSREVPIPSPEQLEFVLDAARRLGDTKTVKALQDMQMQILGVVEELGTIGEAFSNHVKALEQLKFETERRPKDAVDYS